MNPTPTPVCALEDYELDTIKLIRARSPMLNAMTNEQLRDIYREWSIETMCSGWFDLGEYSIAGFIEWATIAPCDRPQP